MKKQEIKEVKEWKGFESSDFIQSYTKDQMIEFAMYCSGHRKFFIESRFEEFENKNIIILNHERNK